MGVGLLVKKGFAYGHSRRPPLPPRHGIHNNGNVNLRRDFPQRKEYKPYQFKGSNKPPHSQPEVKDFEGQKETSTCNYCKKPGHLIKDCFTLKGKEQFLNRSNVVEVVTNQQDEIFNIVDVVGSEGWILDFGCSFHMCPHKEWFVDLKPMESGSVILGNDNTCCVKGIGSFR